MLDFITLIATLNLLVDEDATKNCLIFSSGNDEQIIEIGYHRSINDIYNIIKNYDLASEDDILLAIHLMERLKGVDNPVGIFNEYVYILFVVCLTIIHKIVRDEPFNNYTFAKLLDINKVTFNHIELCILKKLNFELYILDFDTILNVYKSVSNDEHA